MDSKVEELTKRIEKMTSQLEALDGALKRDSSNIQTVIHRSEGMSAWGTAAVVACFCTWFALILFAMEIHDLRAWRDIHQNQISALQAKAAK